MKHDYTCRVVENRTCGRSLKILTLETDGTPFACQAGQFVMLDLPEPRFFFRRPFSVLATPSPTRLEIFYKIVGVGTRQLAELKPGDTLKCLGPLGNSFTPPVEPETALCIGGGIGIAPMALLAQTMTTAANRPLCFYGAASAHDLGITAELEALFGREHLLLATDDGSLEFSGNVCQLLEHEQARVLAAKEAYICGPTRMMAAAATLLRRLNPSLRVEVSLEEHMPCGTGACTGCVVPRADQYLPAKVCVEGPVFRAESIAWSNPITAVAVCPAGEVSACP